MIPFFSSQLLKDTSITKFYETYQEVLNDVSQSYLGCVFTITSSISLTNISNIKNEFKHIKEKYSEFEKEYSITLRSVIQISIAGLKFSDKELSLFLTYYTTFDFVQIYSYSNTQIMQLVSKKCCAQIVNVFSCDSVKRYDFIHHFNSGMNHIIAQELSLKSISVGIDMQSFNSCTASSMKLSKYFSSCIQNSMLCSKKKVPHMCFNVISQVEDIRRCDEYVRIQKSFFNATPFQINAQKSYLHMYFTMQHQKLKGEIVGF